MSTKVSTKDNVAPPQDSTNLVNQGIKDNNLGKEMESLEAEKPSL